MNEQRLAVLKYMIENGPISPEIVRAMGTSASPLYWLVRVEFAKATDESNLHKWDGRFKVTDKGREWYDQNVWSK